MSFKRYYLKGDEIEASITLLHDSRSCSIPIHMFRRSENVMFSDRTRNGYICFGIYQATVIGDYLFIYENWNLISCLHLVDDWKQVSKELLISFGHESDNEEELIELYEGSFVTSCIPTCGNNARSRLVVAAEPQVEARYVIA